MLTVYLFYCSCRYIFVLFFLYLCPYYNIPICHITLLTDVDTLKKNILVSVFFLFVCYVINLPPAYTFSLKQCFSCFKNPCVICVCMQNCSAVQQCLCFIEEAKVAIKLCFNFLFIKKIHLL